MKIEIILAIILLLYLAQALICAFINAINVTRIPINFKDLVKLTFLPWLLRNIKKVKYDFDE